MWREPVPEAPPPTVPALYAAQNIHWQLWREYFRLSSFRDLRAACPASAPLSLAEHDSAHDAGCCADREAGGTTCSDHPRVIPSLQMIIYLDDCDANSHCFSVVRESVAEKRSLPTELVDGRLRVVASSRTGSSGMWTNRPLRGRTAGWEGKETGTDVHAPAGTLIIQNNLNLHAGTVRTYVLLPKSRVIVNSMHSVTSESRSVES